MDKRKQQLVEWLERDLKLKPDSLLPASADASFRRYFRLTVGTDTYIVMDAPPQQEDVQPFIRIARRFREIGLNVPEILRQDEDNGFLLLSDLGDQTYLSVLNEDSVDRLYGDALAALMMLQAGTYREPEFLPAYSRQLLLDEMALFADWLLVKHLGIVLTEGQKRAIEGVYQVLVVNALEQPSVWVHRDFHSRNLMATSVRNPGILDFQDAVLGPVTYDLVSLLKDCYIDWPREQVTSWVRDYHQLSRESGLQLTEDSQEFLRWFDLMGVQRHLKAAGIFARLYHRDGKPGYLADIPRTLGYITQLRSEYPELGPLTDLIESLDTDLIVEHVAAT